MNWLDAVLILALAYFGYAGYRNGFVAGLLELLGIAVSLAIPFFLYPPLSRLLERSGVAAVFAPAVAYLIVWGLVLVVYFSVVRHLYRRIPERVKTSGANAALGVVTGAARGLILLAVLISVLITLPTPKPLHDAVSASRLGRDLANATASASVAAANIFGEAVQRTFGFLTVHPESDRLMRLRFTVIDSRPLPGAEEEMLRLVNRERTSRGLSPVRADPAIRLVARAHSSDMLKRGYFGHNTPEGISPFDRMETGGVRFFTAGENLAIAPTVRMAHLGLMQSPGHRANILRPEFRRVGIGAMSGGRYGIMFTQNFAN